MTKYDIHLAKNGARVSSVCARAVLGYQTALAQRRLRLEQYRAASCNIAREAGGIIDTRSVSQCTMCGNYCRTYLGLCRE